jgi:ComF family protein
MIGLLQKKVIEPIRDFIFTTSCLYCKKRLREGERRLCTECWDSLHEIRNDDYTVEVLRRRFAEHGYIDDFTSLFYFEKGGVLQSLAHSLKYEEVTSFGVELGVKLGKKLLSERMFADSIIPIPLNKRKQRERGYNQSDYLAQGIANVMNIPVLSKTLQRVKYTVTQTHLNAQERKKNIADAFCVSDVKEITEKAIILVDDIITTGSTIQEAANMLKKNRVQKIIVASAGLAKLGEDV